jgi:hypothetical protein
MPAEFYKGSDWQDTSGPYVTVPCHEADVWPIADNSISGTKDGIFTAGNVYDGVHPVVALGGITVADGRPLNVTGVVVSAIPGLTIPLGRVIVNIADGMIVKNYVCNILTYNGGAPATFEVAPVPGQPVFVDDTDDLSAGCTLSLSPLNVNGLKNPQAGVLWYCQDEMADAGQGGYNAAATFDSSLPNSLTEQAYCVLLINGFRDLA